MPEIKLKKLKKTISFFPKILRPILRTLKFFDNNPIQEQTQYIELYIPSIFL